MSFRRTIEKEWIDLDTGYLCRCRMIDDGDKEWRCGYVCVPKDHPASGLDEDDLSLQLTMGITWAESMDDDSSVWWIGFDTMRDPQELEWIEGECFLLAQELKRMADRGTVKRRGRPPLKR